MRSASVLILLILLGGVATAQLPRSIPYLKTDRIESDIPRNYVDIRDSVLLRYPVTLLPKAQPLPPAVGIRIWLDSSSYRIMAILPNSSTRILDSLGAAAPPGSGEANTASNRPGAGVGIYRQKVGVDLQFKRLVNGGGVVITDMTDSVSIKADSSRASGVTDSLRWMYSYFNHTMGIVHKDSLGNILRIDVRDIGGDGAIYSELQLAINAIATRGGEVIIPAGTWDLGTADTAIKITTHTGARSSIRIIGAGMGNVASQADTTHGTVLLYRGSGVAFKLGNNHAGENLGYSLTDLTLKGFRLRSPGLTGQYGIMAHLTRRSLFEDISIERFQTGAYFDHICDFNTFNRVRFWGNRGVACYLFRECDGNSFYDCDFITRDDAGHANAPGDGLHVEYTCQGLNVLGCQFFNFDSSRSANGGLGNYAIYIQGSSNATIQNSYFEEGPIVLRPYADGRNTSGTRIIGNHFVQIDTNWSAIRLDAGAGDTITGIINTQIGWNTFNNSSPPGWETEATGAHAITVEYSPMMYGTVLEGNTYIGISSAVNYEYPAENSVTNLDSLSGKIRFDPATGFLFPQVKILTRKAIQYQGADYADAFVISDTTTNSRRTPNFVFQDNYGDRFYIRKDNNYIAILDTGAVEKIRLGLNGTQKSVFYNGIAGTIDSSLFSDTSRTSYKSDTTIAAYRARYSDSARVAYKAYTADVNTFAFTSVPYQALLAMGDDGVLAFLPAADGLKRFADMTDNGLQYNVIRARSPLDTTWQGGASDTLTISADTTTILETKYNAGQTFLEYGDSTAIQNRLLKNADSTTMKNSLLKNADSTSIRNQSNLLYLEYGDSTAIQARLLKNADSTTIRTYSNTLYWLKTKPLVSSLTVPTGLTIAGDSAKAISLTSGYGIPTTTQMGTWSGKEDVLTFHSPGLTRDGTDIYNDFSTGLGGGQTLYGGFNEGDDLTISSTAHATKGAIIFGTSRYDELNNRLGINSSNPVNPLQYDSAGTMHFGVNENGQGTFGAAQHTSTNHGITVYDEIVALPGHTGFTDIQLWKNATPTKAASFGMSVPGIAIGDDMKFSAYTGAAWGARLTLTNAAITAGKILIGDGAGFVSSTNTFPNASATSGKLMQSDGTNWIASTATWPTTNSAGMVVTGNGTNYVAAKRDSLFILAGNQTTTSNVAAAIPGLSIYMAANETWEIKVVIKAGCSSTGGNKYAVDIPTSATISGTILGNVATNAAMASNWVSADATLCTTAFNTEPRTTAEAGAFVWMDVVVVNGANAGNAIIMYASGTNGQTTTAYAGSYIFSQRRN
jgi:hypothetical protein